jgi:hypothetical protein
MTIATKTRVKNGFNEEKFVMMMERQGGRLVEIFGVAGDYNPIDVEAAREFGAKMRDQVGHLAKVDVSYNRVTITLNRE